MKQIVRYSRKDIILHEMGETFSIDDMNPSLWDFTADVYDVATNLRRLEMDRLDSGAPYNSAAQITAREDLHAELLMFAQSFLSKTVFFLPLAGMVVGYVAAAEHSPASAAKIDRFLQQLENVFVERGPAEGLSVVQFETYYCLARTLPPEFPLTHKIGKIVDDAIKQVYAEDSQIHVRCIVEASSSAHRFQSGDALLMQGIESITDAILAGKSKQPKTIGEQAKDKIDAAEFCSNLVINMPDHAGAAIPIIERFSALWDDLYCLNGYAACGLLDDYAVKCALPGHANGKFVAMIQEKLDLLDMGIKIQSAAHNISTRPVFLGAETRFTTLDNWQQPRLAQ